MTNTVSLNLPASNVHYPLPSFDVFVPPKVSIYGTHCIAAAAAAAAAAAVVGDGGGGGGGGVFFSLFYIVLFTRSLGQ